MSFQAYLDTIEKKTGLTPRELIAKGAERGIAGPDTKAGEVISWLAEDYGLGRGHAMALYKVIKDGATIADTHVGTGTAHSDASNELWLDGAATNPNG